MRKVVRSAMNATLGRERTDAVLTHAIDHAERLRYRTSPEARSSIARLKELREAHAGERCFILGNGPSLGRMDLAPLRDEVTFGLNRGYLVFDRAGFATTYLVCVNRLVLEQCADEFLQASSEKFVAWSSRDLLAEDADVTYLRSTLVPHFSTNAVDGVWEGATVTYVALQLAYWMGFSTAILIGVDHSFSTEGTPHAVVSLAGDDPDHFDPSYFGGGFRWQLPDLETSELAFRLARDAYGRAEKVVLDATVGGKLDVFPKADFDALVGSAERQVVR
jgi:hypothetical protein